LIWLKHYGDDNYDFEAILDEMEPSNDKSRNFAKDTSYYFESRANTYVSISTFF